jgi:hypothetical protein
VAKEIAHIYTSVSIDISSQRMAQKAKRKRKGFKRIKTAAECRERSGEWRHVERELHEHGIGNCFVCTPAYALRAQGPMGMGAVATRACWRAGGLLGFSPDCGPTARRDTTGPLQQGRRRPETRKKKAHAQPQHTNADPSPLAKAASVCIVCTCKAKGNKERTSETDG